MRRPASGVKVSLEVNLSTSLLLQLVQERGLSLELAPRLEERLTGLGCNARGVLLGECLAKRIDHPLRADQIGYLTVRHGHRRKLTMSL